MNEKKKNSPRFYFARLISEYRYRAIILSPILDGSNRYNCIKVLYNAGADIALFNAIKYTWYDSELSLKKGPYVSEEVLLEDNFEELL